MRTIIIHHLQKMWDSGLQRCGTSFEEMLEKVIEHLDRNEYNDVIVTNFEAGFGLDKEQWPLHCFAPVVHDYGYGWEEEMFEGMDVEYTEGGNHSEVVLIDEWMKALDGEVHLCGAFDGECIEDITIALQHVGHDVNRLEDLII